MIKTLLNVAELNQATNAESRIVLQAAKKCSRVLIKYDLPVLPTGSSCLKSAACVPSGHHFHVQQVSLF